MADDSVLRNAAFREVRRLADVNGDLTGRDLRAGFQFDGQRIPLINPQRGIFKPTQMRFLLSIRTVVPRPGARVWYDDQIRVHNQIYQGDEALDYAFMGRDADAAENRWLREAMEDAVPFIYFLGISPSVYRALIPSFVIDWDRSGGVLRNRCGHQGCDRRRPADVGAVEARGAAADGAVPVVQRAAGLTTSLRACGSGAFLRHRSTLAALGR